MTPDLRHRSALALFFALSIATLCGLRSLPALDPLAPLRDIPAFGDLLAGLAYAVLAWGGVWLGLRPIWRGALPTWSRLLMALPVVLGLCLWLFSLLFSPAADARLLCWLTSLPLWSVCAGLLRIDSLRAVSSNLAFSQDPEHFDLDQGAVYHVHMAHRRDVQGLRTWQHRGQSGHHNVVAMPKAAYESHGR